MPFRLELSIPDTPGAPTLTRDPLNGTRTFTRSSSSLRDNPPLVLVRGTAPLTLTPEERGDESLRWSLTRLPDGASSAPDVDPQTGSLRIPADTLEPGLWAVTATAGDATVRVHLAIVDLTIESSLLQLNDDGFDADWSEERFYVTSGELSVTSPGTAAMYCRADVTLDIGELPPGEPGEVAEECLARVHVGFVQSLEETSSRGLFPGGARERERVPRAPLPHLHVTLSDPEEPFEDASLPVLDCGALREPDGGTSVFLSRTVSTPEEGRSRIVETCDSPGIELDITHPVANGALGGALQSHEGSNDFRLHLVAVSDDAPGSYVAFGGAAWSVRFFGKVETRVSTTGSGGGEVAIGTPTVQGWKRGRSCTVRGDSVLTAYETGVEAHLAGAAVSAPLFRHWVLDARPDEDP